MEARKQGGIGLSCRPARLYRLAEFIPWNQFHTGSVWCVLTYSDIVGKGGGEQGHQQENTHLPSHDHFIICNYHNF
jgi:hypothetical protein